MKKQYPKLKIKFLKEMTIKEGGFRYFIDFFDFKLDRPIMYLFFSINKYYNYISIINWERKYVDFKFVNNSNPKFQKDNFIGKYPDLYDDIYYDLGFTGKQHMWHISQELKRATYETLKQKDVKELILVDVKKWFHCWRNLNEKI